MMMRPILAALACSAILTGCAQLRGECPAGLQSTWRAELLLGRHIGGTLGVSDADWRDFVTAEVASRFPACFTVVDAAGEWRGENGTTVHEPSKALVVMAPAGADTRARLDAIAAAYKTRFHQESVGLVVMPACASF